MPRISPARTESETWSTASRPRSLCTCKFRDLQHGRAERRCRALDIEDHVAADHQARQFARVGGRRVQFGDDPAGPHHRHPVGHGHDLLELVGDQQDRLAARLQAAEKIEERPDLARRQHARRLVQDEDVGVAVEQLQDLDALLAAHGQTPDRLVRIDVEAEGSAELLKPADVLLEIEAESAAEAEDDVLDHRQGRHQHEMLMDHADAMLQRRPRAVDRRPRARRRGCAPRPAGRGRRGCSSASTCRRRSRRGRHAPCRARRAG